MYILLKHRFNLKVAITLVITILSFQFSAFCMIEEEDKKSLIHSTRINNNLMFPATSMPNSDWWHNLWPDPKSVILSLGIKKEATVIDLCCGDGYFTFPLAEVSSKVYGIELDSNLLEQAKKEAEIKKLENCSWIQGDAMKLPNLVSEPVDFVFVANTFHGIPEKESLGKSIFSILKLDGELGIINWHKKPRENTIVLGLPRGPKTEMRMSPEEVEKIILPLGFESKKCIELPPYHYGIIFKKVFKKFK